MPFVQLYTIHIIMLITCTEHPQMHAQNTKTYKTTTTHTETETKQDRLKQNRIQKQSQK